MGHFQRPARRLDTERGFTLLELTMVLLVAGILLALAVPRLPGAAAARLDASAERLASTMGWLADEASLRGRVYRLTLDLDHGTWDTEVLAPWSAEGSAGFVVSADGPAPSGTLPEGAFFRLVSSVRRDASAGLAEVHFLPEGVAEGLRVVLEDSRGTRAEVVLDAARSSARSYGHAELPR